MNDLEAGNDSLFDLFINGSVEFKWILHHHFSTLGFFVITFSVDDCTLETTLDPLFVIDGYA